MLVANNNQRTRLFQFAGTARFAYNWALRKEIDAYEAGEKFISNLDLRKEFTVLRNSAEYPWLRTISNNVTKQAIKDCVDAYQKFDGLNWWLSVAVEFAAPKPAENCGDSIGIDLGIKNLATCSDGTIYPNINDFDSPQIEEKTA